MQEFHDGFEFGRYSTAAGGVAMIASFQDVFYHEAAAVDDVVAAFVLGPSGTLEGGHCHSH